MPHIEKSRVEEIIKNGYQFDLGEYISRGFKVFSKEWVLFSLYCLVSCFIIFASALTIIGFVFLIFPIFMGYPIAADKVEAGEKLKFSDFFQGFKNYRSYAVLALIFVVGYALIYIPFFFIYGFSFFDNFDGRFGVFSLSLTIVYMFVMIIGVYLLMLCLFFAPYLIHYGNYSGVEAIKASFKLSFKNFWWQLLFLLITGIIGGIGQYLCLIGMFASLPAAMVMNYMLVKTVLVNEDYVEIDEIGQPSV